MLKHHQWSSKGFDKLVEDLGAYNHKSLLLEVANALWKRDCMLQREGKKKLEKVRDQWDLVAKGLCDCGLSPSKSLRQILNKVIPRDPKLQNFEVSF